MNIIGIESKLTQAKKHSGYTTIAASNRPIYHPITVVTFLGTDSAAYQRKRASTRFIIPYLQHLKSGVRGAHKSCMSPVRPWCPDSISHFIFATGAKR